MKKKFIYSNLTERSENQLGELKLCLRDLSKNQFFYGFLIQEFSNRIDAVIWDEEMKSDEKLGALKEISSMMGLISGGGISSIENILKSRMKEDKKINPENFEDFKNQVLK